MLFTKENTRLQSTTVIAAREPWPQFGSLSLTSGAYWNSDCITPAFVMSIA